MHFNLLQTGACIFKSGMSIYKKKLFNIRILFYTLQKHCKIYINIFNIYLYQ